MLNGEILYQSKGIILFDGICNLCNFWVNFIIDRDKRNYFLFAPLQSETAKYLTKKYNIDTNKINSVILIEKNNYYIKSTAIIKISGKLKGFWKMFYVAVIIPPFIRNIFYNIAAKYRYRWFGKREECRIPTPEIRQKFLA